MQRFAWKLVIQIFIFQQPIMLELNVRSFQIGRECMACRERAAVFDMSYFGKYYLVGPDAAKAVDWIFSNNLRKDTGTRIFFSNKIRKRRKRKQLNGNMFVRMHVCVRVHVLFKTD